jgi:hypothetical protein
MPLNLDRLSAAENRVPYRDLKPTALFPYIGHDLNSLLLRLNLDDIPRVSLAQRNGILHALAPVVIILLPKMGRSQMVGGGEDG